MFFFKGKHEVPHGIANLSTKPGTDILTTVIYIYDTYLHYCIAWLFQILVLFHLTCENCHAIFLAEESCQTAAEPTEKMPKKMVTPGR